MTSALRPAVAYALAVFAVGFVLGVLRVVWIAPRTGETVAVALELPVILALSWAVAGWALGRWPLQRGAARLGMGAIALAVLLGCEIAMALALGTTPGRFVASLATPPGLLGLAGQGLFALIPWLRGRA